jgi:hypothetical protein
VKGQRVNAVREDTTVQTCVIHLPRNTFRHAAHQGCDSVRRVRPEVGRQISDGSRIMAQRPGRVHHILSLDVEIRKIIFTANAPESLPTRSLDCYRLRTSSVGKPVERSVECFRHRFRRVPQALGHNQNETHQPPTAKLTAPLIARVVFELLHREVLHFSNGCWLVQLELEGHPSHISSMICLLEKCWPGVVRLFLQLPLEVVSKSLFRAQLATI